MTEEDISQLADWRGQSGERWVAYQARLDAMMAVFGQAAIEAAAPVTGEGVLDVGCGAGASSLDLAGHVGAWGHVLGVDISGPLIDRARALAPQDTPAVFQVADASSAELPEGTFDILFSRFGVMFFDDPTAAFAHMRRALKPGARVAFVCWRGMAENDWVRLPIGAMKSILPPMTPPHPEAPGAFSFGDQARDAALDEAVAMTLEVGPLARALADQTDDIRARAAAAIRAAFAGCPGERSVMINGATWIVTARNPAS